MPEMPEVEGLRTFLEEALVGRTVTRTELAAFSALKTFATPLSALQGMDVDAVRRLGKFLAVEVGGLHLVPGVGMTVGFGPSRGRAGVVLYLSTEVGFGR